MSNNNEQIIQQQMSSLDSTDPLAQVWHDHVLSQVTTQTSLRQQRLLWGKRGRDGRGFSRMTIQPHDIILEDVTLEYISDESSGMVGSKVLLQNAKLKLLSSAVGGGGENTMEEYDSSSPFSTIKGKVYALVGRNGCGKSTLLRRMEAKKIPGFVNLNLKTMYIPQEVFDGNFENNVLFQSNNNHNDSHDETEFEKAQPNLQQQQQPKTPLEVVLGFRKKNQKESTVVTRKQIEALELQLDNPDVQSNEDEMERIFTEISLLEDQLEHNNDDNDNNNDCRNNNENENENRPFSTAPTTSNIYENGIVNRAARVLEYFGINDMKQHSSMEYLSGGQKKKVMLACALFCDLDILLLDEPTNHLDMKGIIQLRGLIQTMAERNTIVVIVSHDVDLINSVATDVIHFHDQILTYYRGNYVDFQIQKQQHDLHKMRQQHTLDKQRKSMIKTIDNLKSKSSSGNSKKISKQMNNRRKKLEKHGIEKDEHGHRRTVQKAMTGIKIGSINTLDASTRKQGSKNYAQLLKDASLNVAPIPDKEVQFSFRTTNCQWYEPLISASGVGHGFEVVQDANTNTSNTNNDEAVTTIFDDIDLCMDEKSITCILGEGGSGKSTLLKILAGEIQPRKGKVKYAHNINIAYFDQHKADNLIVEGMTKHGSKTSSISLLMALYPKKSEQDIRGILTSFGLSPQQASTYIQYLSGGERCRLCLAMLMLSDPHVLILDEPSNHLDPESVDALHHGIRHWNGTIVLVSHDVHLIRQLEDVKCYVLVKEGKLKYVMGGIDSYLKAVSMQESKKIESESE